ncbi:MAG: hypothetical protein B7Z35_06650 [Hydrogenophilales bacterium 12-61-10]|nr:MAG: hypothetical protein B7Z35_06650 [Hydrogenophilales bacterium 12-61-10]OYX28351.1 MAG: hypothetical protein B7Z03_11845 [Hydrogenophilales bacterium 32-62-9]
MRTRWLIVGILVLATQAQAEEGRYEALPLAGADGGKGGGRALIVDTREGHVWVWSENELLNSPSGQRRYGSGFIYQGKLRPGTQPGEIIEQQSR